jgi:hypothetical protein
MGTVTYLLLLLFSFPSENNGDSHLFIIIIIFFSFWLFYISLVCLHVYLTSAVQAQNPKSLLKVPSAIVRQILYRTNAKDSTHLTGQIMGTVTYLLLLLFSFPSGFFTFLWSACVCI